MVTSKPLRPTRAPRRLLGLAALLLCVACANDFEHPSIVVDLRVLGVRTDPAEVVVDVNLSDLDSLVVPAVNVTALVADPTGLRGLAYTFTACPVTDTLRCDDPAQPRVVFAADITTDLDARAPSGQLQADATLLRAALDADRFHGLGGIPVQLELSIRAADDSSRSPVVASKQITYAPRVPPTRTANQNPTIDALNADGMPTLPEVPLSARVGQELLLQPVEPEGAREVYSVPTLDGGERTFTENLRYSWFATKGSFSDEHTGGAIDIFGNRPLLRTRWTAPPLAGPVQLWMVQRDERGGIYWTNRAIIVHN
jgi:hypothetical protein